MALRWYSDGKLWQMLLWRYKMINLQASENTYDFTFGLVSAISLMGLLISCKVCQAVTMIKKGMFYLELVRNAIILSSVTSAN